MELLEPFHINRSQPDVCFAVPIDLKQTFLFYLFIAGRWFKSENDFKNIFEFSQHFHYILMNHRKKSCIIEITFLNIP